MKLRDMLKMSLSSLWKRKVRTILTILGVVIGVASIVVMVSLGIGLKTSMMTEMENYASLTEVRVETPYDIDSSSKKATDFFLSDDMIKRIKEIDHVEEVYPQLNTSVVAKVGKYILNLQVLGMKPDGLERLNIKVGAGNLPEPGHELEFFYGKFSVQDYYDPRNGTMPYWEAGKTLDFDPMKKPMEVYLDGDSYSSATSGGTDDNGKPVKMPKKYKIKASGVEEGFNSGEESDYTATAYNVYCDIDALITALKKEFRNKTIPGQPTTKTGKPYKDVYYSMLAVEVDSMDHVTEVQKAITEMGLNAYSDAEWIQQQQNSMNMIQAVLGGIGAVSLLVAAIGIANTMMMSIYERTKEIGVMKVLGCELKNIRNMFLMEAAYIGFFGGIVGVGFSYLVSAIINSASAGSDSMDMGIMYVSSDGGGISLIPPWLALLSILFAVIIGMVSGFFPARRAMHLSALAAIKNE